MDITSAAAAAAEVGGILGEAMLKKRGRSAGRAALRGLGCLEEVTGTATACVGVHVDVWVRLHELEGWHFDGC